MKIKRAIRATSLTLLFLAAYLGVAAVWAAVSFEDAMAHMPVAARSPLSARQTAILLKVEDPTFYTHHGLSLADGQGTATISSALARELYLSDLRLSGIEGVFQHFYRAVFGCCRKIDVGRDTMALVLDAKLPKARQLALYADRVYMGTYRGMQVRGLEPAAHIYFGKPLQDLTEHEFIGLVAMIKAPNQYHPVRAAAEHAQRVARIEALLAGQCRPGGWFDTSLDRCAR
jgi:membrane carboxypeptidase/penicillin-binding protein